MTAQIPVQIANAINLYGYPAIFAIMVVEGPIITFLAAFAASLKYLDPVAVFALSWAGNVVPDAFYFILIRRTISSGTVEAFMKRLAGKLGAEGAAIDRLEQRVFARPTLYMLIIKAVPSLPPFGLPIASLALDVKTYFSRSIVISGIYSGVFFLLGYYAGRGYGSIEHALNVAYAAGGIIVALSIVYIIWIAASRPFKKWFLG